MASDAALVDRLGSLPDQLKEVDELGGLFDQLGGGFPGSISGVKLGFLADQPRRPFFLACLFINVYIFMISIYSTMIICWGSLAQLKKVSDQFPHASASPAMKFQKSNVY